MGMSHLKVTEVFFQCSQHKQFYLYIIYCFHYFVHCLYLIDEVAS